MIPRAQSARSGYVPEIDALRALAVLSVMVFHLNSQWLPGGFAGVDVFLVISGYVISRSMTTIDRETLPRFVAAFYARRFLRILPALLVCVSVTLFVTTLFVPVAWLSVANYETARYALWGFGNYGLINSQDNYFAPRIDFNPFAHTWSLGVEEQFYLIFPVVFFLWLRSRSAPSAVRLGGRLVLPLLLLASLGYCAWATRATPTLAYYLLPSRFWELAAGALLFQAHDRDSRIVGRSTTSQSTQLMASFALLAVGFVFSRESAFPFPWALAAVAGTVGIIDGVMAQGSIVTQWVGWMRWSPLVETGRLSYSLYLWHWPVYVLFRWTVGLESWSTKLLAVGLTFVISRMSYLWIETPFRHGPITHRAHRYLVLAGGLGCMAVVSKAAHSLYVRQYLLSLSVTRDAALWQALDWTPPQDRVDSACVGLHTLSTMPGGGRLERYLRAGCRDDRAVTELFVTGDSHAEALRTLLSELVATRPFNVRYYFHENCAAPYQLVVSPRPPACRAFDEEVRHDVLRRARPGDIFFLPGLRIRRLGDQWALRRPDTSGAAALRREADNARYRAADETYGALSPLLRAGVRVVFEAPKPVFRSPPFRCSDWFNRHNPICEGGLTASRAFILEYRRPVLERMVDLTLRDSGISVWDPMNVLCPTSTCESIIKGKPLFFDGDHLSGYGNRLLYSDFAAFMERSSNDAPHEATIRRTP